MAIAAHIADKSDAQSLLQAASSEGNWLAKKLSQNEVFKQTDSGPTILIVDDEVELAEIYSDFLVAHNYRTLVAHNYQQAMAKIKTHHDIALMILDLKLPEVNGLQILKNLKELKLMVGIPKFLCTAFASPDLVAKARELGAVHYIVKPVNFDELLVQINKYTSWKDAL
jgi:DNA-binding response OmpR family regulator